MDSKSAPPVIDVRELVQGKGALGFDPSAVLGKAKQPRPARKTEGAKDA